MLQEALATATAGAAGVIILAAIIPEIVRCYKSEAHARAVVRARFVMQAVGNALWAYHGVLVDNQQLAAMTATGCILALVVLGQSLASARRR